jgi:hypothetical protein
MVYRNDRVMIFIDGSNMYHSLKENFPRTDIDAHTFCDKLLEKRRLVRIYYYNCAVGRREEPESYVNQEAFCNSVKIIPYFNRGWVGSSIRIGRRRLLREGRRYHADDGHADSQFQE